MKFIKQLSRLFPRKKQNSSDKGKDSSKDKGSDMDRLDISQLRDLTEKEKLKTKLQDNLSLVQQYHGNSLGLKIREIRIGPDNIKAAAIFIDGMVDSVSVDELLSSVFISSMKSKELPPLGDPFLKYLKEKVIPSTTVEEVTELNDFFDRVLIGDTALVIDGLDTALVAETKGWKTRAIDESDAEISIRGPREAFVESINDNLSLLRRRIRVPQLWVEKFIVGSLTRTQVAVVYIKGLAGEEILKELRSRIEKVDTDSILDSGQLEEFIEDTPFTLFPLTLRTERPDRISAALLEGQVAIIVDGTPFALTVPITLFTHLQAPEDHFERVPVGSFIRALRFAAIVLALFLPGVYVAVVNFHHELIPTDLFLRIASNREGIPFPIVVEMLIMETVFELLRESGVRLPAAIGPAVSIVGALVLGDAAIRAGIVSPPVVVVVALTAIASFAVPNFALGLAIRILRFGFILIGSVFGLFGIQFGFLLLIIHLCSLRSFGIPYMSPLAPMIPRDLKDFIFRIWQWGFVYRPKLTGFREPIRKSPRQARSFFKLFPHGEEGQDED